MTPAVKEKKVMKTRLIVGLTLALGAGQSFADTEETLSFDAANPVAIALEKALSHLYWEQGLVVDVLPSRTSITSVESKKALIPQEGADGGKLLVTCNTKVTGINTRAPKDIFLGCSVAPYIEPIIVQDLPQLTVWKFLFLNK